MTTKTYIKCKVLSLLLTLMLAVGLTAPFSVCAADDVCQNCGGTGQITTTHKHTRYCKGYVKIEGGTFTPQLATKLADTDISFKLKDAQDGDRLVIEQWYYITNSSSTAKLPRFEATCDIEVKSGDCYAASNSKSGVAFTSFTSTMSDIDVHGERVCYIRSGEFDPTWSKLDDFVHHCDGYDIGDTDTGGWNNDLGFANGFIKGSDRFEIHAPVGLAGQDEQFFSYTTAEITNVANIQGFRFWSYFDTGSGKKTSTSTATVTYRTGRWSVWRKAYLCGLEEGENTQICEACCGTGKIAKNAIVTEETKKVTPNEDNSCLVEADIGSSFVVTIPKKIVLDACGCARYKVSMTGDIKGSEYVYISPILFNGGIYLREGGGKKDVLASVVQQGTDFLTSGSYEGQISADISAGSWSGVLEFELALASK